MKTSSFYRDGTIAWQLRSFPIINDESGSLGVVEHGKEIDFVIKRAFFLRGVREGAIRGAHAHKNLKQLVICLSGSFTIELDTGIERQKILMQANQQSLFIDGKVWRTMHTFTADAVMLVLCDREYKHDIVIRNYDEFKALKEEQ